MSIRQILKAKANRLKHIQAETGDELDALMPAVLDKALAFKFHRAPHNE